MSVFQKNDSWRKGGLLVYDPSVFFFKSWIRMFFSGRRRFFFGIHAASMSLFVFPHLLALVYMHSVLPYYIHILLNHEEHFREHMFPADDPSDDPVGASWAPIEVWRPGRLRALGRPTR